MLSTTSFALPHFLIVQSGSWIWTLDLRISGQVLYHCVSATALQYNGCNCATRHNVLFSSLVLMMQSSSCIWTLDLRISGKMLYHCANATSPGHNGLIVTLSIISFFNSHFSWCQVVCGSEPLNSGFSSTVQYHCATATGCPQHNGFNCKIHHKEIFSWSLSPDAKLWLDLNPGSKDQ